MSSYANGFTKEYRNLILELPRDWVMKNIEAEVDGVLVNEGYEEYRCLLELCCDLDRGLMIKFAKRALDSSDEDIRMQVQIFCPANLIEVEQFRWATISL
ncbi:hypothetical protein [Burkholderia cepacia]|uniref:hypothetical protein n=1 Tax=Burkholderia cepacia TaxID=292 RepID=UPI001CF2D808|nr:hypothetical protein [Burkholderia cepacia]MCA8053410.1 hypothetical protein [Burkholderia cepacia]MCA8132289.1 hypothetical protein [Burkholderia cepacia]HEM7893107.1 hypothetical protein [Burkholderia cepacia]HEM8508187.1 hypothetical protein [Burkholderia cepacia]